MNDIKPWQIVLIIVAVGVLAFSAFRMMGQDKIKGASGLMTVDVMTGQLYMVQKGKARGIVYPVKHPETGDRTLYPVIQEDGSDRWEISPRMEAGIPDDIRDKSKVLGSGGQINILDSDPITLVIKK